MNKSLKQQLLAQFYRRNLPIFLLSVLAALAGSSVNLLLSWLIQQLLDTVSEVAGSRPLSELAKLTGGFLVLTALFFLLKYSSEPRFIRRAMRQYKEFAFQKLTEKRISAFRDESTAAYLSALTNDASSVEADYLAQQLSVITMAVTFCGALAMMLVYSPLLTAVAVGVTLLPLAASLLTGKQLQTAERRVSDRNRDFTAMLSDCLGGFQVVKTFRAEREIFRLFAENNRALEDEKFDRRRLKALVGMIGSLAGITAQLGVFLFGAWMALSGRGITAGTLILFVNLMNFLIEPVAQLPALLAGRRAARGLIGKLADALEQNTSSVGSAALPGGLKRGIRLEQVTFGYEPGKDVLRGVCAELQAGGAYAVVGASGSGKSTLLHLLMGGSADYRGKILLDGTELRELAPEALYELLSVIQQNVFVFNASIQDNVAMFRSFPQAELDAALSRAHLGELLAKRGADTPCGENGRELSGGEKQRISIARSLLKRSSILLADEATSALDAQTARQVSDDLLDLTGVTRILVTHKLDESVLRRCDGILVLKNGALVESGRFDELMEQDGYFRALFTVSQN